jgi:8-oxo-dGTP pyrophosphatase MutT (NUDIX family)
VAEPAEAPRGPRSSPLGSSALHPKSRLLTKESGAGRYPNLRPRDAATLIILDESTGTRKVLMGQRHLGHKFMPGKFVFPGGRVEPQDYIAPDGFPLADVSRAKLLRAIRGIAHPARARALVNAALRETREETGLVIAPEAGERNADEPGALTFLARAITPPGRPRRFDTRFFVVPASRIAERLEIVDGEFSAIHWLTLAEARAANLPLITGVILDELEERLTAGGLAEHEHPVPFYFKRGACFHRLLL